MKGEVHPKPREQMITDLNTYITNRKQKNDIICILGDINENLQHQDYMASICNTHGLYDVFAYLYPNKATSPTYKWGKTRLDYMLLSSNAPMPNRTGYQPYDLFHSSDHRSMYMDVILNRSNSDKIPNSEICTISTKSKNITKFINIIYEHCNKNNVFYNLKSFSMQDNNIDIGLGNKIDKQLTQGILKALKKCSSTKNHSWSLHLHNASLRVKFWKIALTSSTKNLPPALKLIRQIIKDLPEYLPARTTKKKRLKDALTQL